MGWLTFFLDILSSVHLHLHIYLLRLICISTNRQTYSISTVTEHLYLRCGTFCYHCIFQYYHYIIKNVCVVLDFRQSYHVVTKTLPISFFFLHSVKSKGSIIYMINISHDQYFSSLVINKCMTDHLQMRCRVSGYPVIQIVILQTISILQQCCLFTF